MQCVLSVTEDVSMSIYGMRYKDFLPFPIKTELSESFGERSSVLPPVCSREGGWSSPFKIKACSVSINLCILFFYVLKLFGCNLGQQGIG